MIPFCKPYLSGNETKHVLEALNSGWITTGPMTARAEERIAEHVGAKHCVLVTSCTAALGLAINYFKQKYEKQSFTAFLPSLTFAATATEVIHAGGEVIFGDVGRDFLLKKEPGKYDLAIPVHLMGDKAQADYRCHTIEDSAQRFIKDQCKDNPNTVCFSFYATKNLTMGEGGAICTNNDEEAEWYRKARHHGISKDGWKRYDKEGGSWKYDIEFIGWKANPSDLLAGVILGQLERIEEINAKRAGVIALYNMLFEKENTGLHLYPILVKDRDKFIKEMSKEGIQCSVHFQPLHKMTAFKNTKILNKLTNTEDLGEKVVSLPLYPGLRNYEIEKIWQTAKKTKQLL